MTSGRFKASIIFSLLGLALFASSPANGEVMAALMQVHGNVEIKTAGSQDWIRANSRMRVREGDQIRTGPKSRAILKLSEGNLVVVAPDTEMKVEQLASGLMIAGSQPEIRLDLFVGELSSSLQRLQGASMTLTTPVSVTGVRGTEFTANLEKVNEGGIDQSYNFEVAVYDGQVEVTDLRQPTLDPVQVSAGFVFSMHGVVVPPGGFSGGEHGGSGGGPQGPAAGSGGPGTGGGPRAGTRGSGGGGPEGADGKAGPSANIQPRGMSGGPGSGAPGGTLSPIGVTGGMIGLRGPAPFGVRGPAGGPGANTFTALPPGPLTQPCMDMNSDSKL